MIKTGLVAAVLFAIVTPALAASPAPAPVPPAAVQPLPSDCPVMAADPSLSDTTRSLFAVIANACKLRNAGLIEESQFQMIRDQAVNDLIVEMQAQAEARMNQRFAANP